MKKHAVASLAFATILISGCASHFPYQMVDFHDASLMDSAKAIEVRPSFTAGITGGAIEATGELSKNGAVGFIYDTTRSSGVDAYRLVTVSSDDAPNLRWEVWARTDSAIGLGSRQYKKIMGPFKNGEEVKVMFVNNAVGNSLERNMAFVVYSPTETNRKVKLNMSEVKR